MPTDAPSGSTIGPYEIERELGRGAFGVVYLARHVDEPEIPIALKIIDAQGNIEKLKQEPALIAKLNHPCIIRIQDSFVHQDSKLAIALEYISGEDLRTAIEATEQFPATVVRDLLLQIGGALAEAHAKGVVHRDLKPANILMDQTSGRTRYVLTDFGVGAEQEGILAEKKVAGTYLFMAPEQLRGRPGPQSDLWALGVIAYRMLTGKYPFPGPGIQDLTNQIQFTTPLPPSKLTQEKIDSKLERVILKLLDRSETERISSAQELLKQLGHSSTTQTTFKAIKPVRPGKSSKFELSLEESLRTEIRQSYLWMTLYAALWLLITGPVGGLIVFIAMMLFFRAHNRFEGKARFGWIVGAFALLISYRWAEYVGVSLDSLLTKELKLSLSSLYMNSDPNNPPPAWWSIVLGLISFASSILIIVLPVYACSNYANANRLRRERVLLNAAAAGGTSQEYLNVLRRELDYRYEDVGFHLKYAEALAACGDHRQSAIEARLLLQQDPYHFGGNLLLAQNYFRLGLYADCQQVCEDYLAVAGYCFEFAELRDQCRKQLGANR